jgi:hypothetical protein
MAESLSPGHWSVDRELAERYAGGRLEKTLLCDFRQSFRFSGSEYNQHVIFPLLGFVYARTDEATQQGIEEALDSIAAKESWRQAALPPAQHRPVDEEHFLRESANEWNKFQEIVRPSYIRLLEKEDEEFVGLEVSWEEEMLRALGDNIVDSDIKILESPEGRPRSNADRRYTSYFREHVILGKPTGSPVFDDIFVRLSESVSVHLLSGTRLLINRWRLRHPGQTFFPGAIDLVDKELLSLDAQIVDHYLTLRTRPEDLKRGYADDQAFLSRYGPDIGMQAVRHSVEGGPVS